MSDPASSSPRLLVSVRSVEEASAALAGGADLIDVKEPNRGSLGRADEATIAAIVQHLAGRLPVSAALGELLEADASDLPDARLLYAKWGLAGWQRAGDWGAAFHAAAAALHRVAPQCEPVVVAYADWERAAAPLPGDVAAFASRHGFPLLLDTHTKDGSTLLDWLPLPRLAALCGACHGAGIPIALAGSLNTAALAAVLPLRPDWIAVRGAACVHGEREGVIDAARVRGLRQLLL